MHPGAAHEFDRLRRYRSRRPEQWSIAESLQAQARNYQKLSKKLGGIAEAWEQICPPDLIARTAIDSLNRGVLTIGVSDAATRFTLDRLLRTGAERELIRRSPITVRRVRLALGQPDHTPRP